MIHCIYCGKLFDVWLHKLVDENKKNNHFNWTTVAKTCFEIRTDAPSLVVYLPKIYVKLLKTIIVH